MSLTLKYVHCTYHDFKKTFTVEVTTEILSILEDETKKRAPSTDNLWHNIIETCKCKTAFTLPKLKQHNTKGSFKSTFIIRHFATDVCYSSVILNRNS